MSTEADGPALAERMALKMFVEACLVLEEGVVGARDIDLGMMAGAGIVPPPLARADAAGLDEVLAALERAEAEWGEAFAPPLILRRLVAQGRLGRSAGQGFFPYPRPDAGFDDGPVLLESGSPTTTVTRTTTDTDPSRTYRTFLFSASSGRVQAPGFYVDDVTIATCPR